MSTAGTAGAEDLAHVLNQFKKVEESLRQKLVEKGDTRSPDRKMKVINYTHLSGRCGDKVIGVNVSSFEFKGVNV